MWFSWFCYHIPCPRCECKNVHSCQAYSVVNALTSSTWVRYLSSAYEVICGPCVRQVDFLMVLWSHPYSKTIEMRSQQIKVFDNLFTTYILVVVKYIKFKTLNVMAAHIFKTTGGGWHSLDALLLFIIV